MTSRRRGPPRGRLLAGGVGALIVIVALIAALGSEDGAPDVSTTIGADGGSPAAAAPAKYLKPIAVGGFPVGLSIHDNEVSMATRSGARLLNVDKMTREVVTSTELPGQGEDVAVIGRFVWVTMPLEDAVAKVSLDYENPATYAAVETIPVGDEPRGIVSADGSLWVADLGSSEISRINPDSGEVTAIPLDAGAEPTDIAFDETALWVTDRAGDQVIRREVEGDGEEGFPVGDNPKGVAIFEEQVWVANTDSGDVSRLGLDGEPTGEPIDVDGTPRGIASGFGSVWVANGGEQDEEGYVSAIDPAGGRPQRVDLAGSPEEIAEGPKLMWVTTGSGDSLASIDPDPTDDEP